MANTEQLSILKEGVDVWNRWREDHRDIVVDLSGANLRETALAGANLNRARLAGVDLSGARLDGADLNKADLSKASLIKSDLLKSHLKETDLFMADLMGANLREANFSMANLRKANLSHATIFRADLSKADLTGCNLTRADLTGTSLLGSNLYNSILIEANLQKAYLGGTNLSKAELQRTDFSWMNAANTNFGDLNLRQVLGLDKVQHLSPSTVGTDTFTKSMGKIPKEFLRGCGLSDWEIEEVKLYSPNLRNDEIDIILSRINDFRTNQVNQISPLFISYSHADTEFVDHLGTYLDQKGIRYWRDIHQATAGPLEEQVNRAIRQNPTVVVVLSEHSIQSDWVEHEVQIARQTEKDLGRNVLCPVALDGSWKKSSWLQRIMEQVMKYNILDFSAWKDSRKFEETFRRLLDGLELFYK